MALSLPSVNNSSPLSEVDVAAAVDPFGITQVGPRDASTGLPTGTGSVQSLVTKAYELLARPTLRDELLFDRFVTVRPSSLSHNGAAVQFNFVPDIDDDPANHRLDELYDVAPSVLKSYTHDITMFEYGQAITTTALVDATTMIPVDPIAAERLARAAASNIDRLVLAALEGTGGVLNDGTPNAVAPVDKTQAGDPTGTLLAVKEQFKSDNIMPFMGGMYVAIITPAEETALRSQTDPGGWRYWQTNVADSGMGDIARGSIGMYEGFVFFTSNRISKAHFLGYEALAKAFSMRPGFGPMPRVVVSPQTDRLRRFVSIGWKHLVGYDRFRAEAILSADLTAVPV